MKLQYIILALQEIERRYDTRNADVVSMYLNNAPEMNDDHRHGVVLQFKPLPGQEQASIYQQVARDK